MSLNLTVCATRHSIFRTIIPLLGKHCSKHYLIPKLEEVEYPEVSPKETSPNFVLLPKHILFPYLDCDSLMTLSISIVLCFDKGRSWRIACARGKENKKTND